MELMSTDSARAFYGYKHVKMANEQLAIETLMVSDSLFRSQDVLQRKKYVELVESVKNQVGFMGGFGFFGFLLDPSFRVFRVGFGRLRYFNK